MTAQQQFPERPVFEPLLPYELKGKTQLYVFTKDWHYGSRFKAGMIPAGFTTDFASIPGFFRRYLDDDSPVILYPALRHDHRYATGALSRKDADTELIEGMEVCGARWDQRQAVRTAVRLFGGRHYRKLSP